MLNDSIILFGGWNEKMKDNVPTTQIINLLDLSCNNLEIEIARQYMLLLHKNNKFCFIFIFVCLFKSIN